MENVTAHYDRQDRTHFDIELDELKKQTVTDEQIEEARKRLYELEQQRKEVNNENTN